MPGTNGVAFSTLLASALFLTILVVSTGNPLVPVLQVLSFDGDMIALNGRIHEISEPLRAPAPDIFSLLSSRSELSGWADWVEEVRCGRERFLAAPLGSIVLAFPVRNPADSFDVWSSSR